MAGEKVDVAASTRLLLWPVWLPTVVKSVNTVVLPALYELAPPVWLAADVETCSLVPCFFGCTVVKSVRIVVLDALYDEEDMLW